jgi:hypothetical protein
VEKEVKVQDAKLVWTKRWLQQGEKVSAGNEQSKDCILRLASHRLQNYMTPSLSNHKTTGKRLNAAEKERSGVTLRSGIVQYSWHSAVRGSQHAP